MDLRNGAFCIHMCSLTVVLNSFIWYRATPTKQDGNHEPESLHVLRRWIDHNKMTVH